MPHQEPKPPPEPRYVTPAGFIVILACTVLVGTFSDSLFHLIFRHVTRRTGWVGPLCAVCVFAYLVSAERTKRIRQLLAGRLL